MTSGLRLPRGRVMVTGARGFVGRAVVNALLSGGAGNVVGTSRRVPVGERRDVAWYETGPINSDTDWRPVIEEVETVVHTAGVVHQPGAAALDYVAANTDGTIRLAKDAADSGVRRLVFISTVGVHGRSSVRPITELDPPKPETHYAKSKLAAEEGLMDLAQRSALEVVIIRPPLVYGPDAPGNFGRLVKCVSKGVPLPVKLIRNQRTVVGLNNLVNLVLCVMSEPAAANETFLVGDAEDMSTPEMIRRLGQALGKPARLFPVPLRIIKVAATVTGRGQMLQPLYASLQIDTSKVRKRLGWCPPDSVEDGFAQLKGGTPGAS